MRRIVPVATLLPAFLALASARGAAQSRTLDVGDVHIAYAVVGAGRAVVLIHGWALNLHEWDDQIPALAAHYRVVVYDRRGYGRSTGFADPSADPGDLRALLDSLHIRTAVLVGHSAGADIASRFTAAMPERVDALVLYGGSAPDGFPVPSNEPGFDFVKAFARQHGVDSLLRMVIALPQFRPGPHRTPRMAARLDSMLGAYNGRDLLEDHPESGAYPRATFEVVRRWRMPTLFISGEREAPRWHLVADSLARWMPNARKVVIPGGGHGVHFDEPARFNAALLAFLRDLGGAR